MRLAFSSILRAALIAVTLGFNWSPSATVEPSIPALTGQDESTGIYPEVRLRKLHLVRPDLIPYPLAIEVMC
jgi:hypothetical protein